MLHKQIQGIKQLQGKAMIAGKLIANCTHSPKQK
jgi:hypothetical protein